MSNKKRLHEERVDNWSIRFGNHHWVAFAPDGKSLAYFANGNACIQAIPPHQPMAEMTVPVPVVLRLIELESA
jgi:hypothetical protein